MHEKMLKTIDLYWFHNDASGRNNSINGHSNKPQINMNRGSSYLLSKKSPRFVKINIYKVFSFFICENQKLCKFPLGGIGIFLCIWRNVWQLMQFHLVPAESIILNLTSYLAIIFVIQTMKQLLHSANTAIYSGNSTSRKVWKYLSENSG